MRPSVTTRRRAWPAACGSDRAAAVGAGGPQLDEDPLLDGVEHGGGHPGALRGAALRQVDADLEQRGVPGADAIEQADALQRAALAAATEQIARARGVLRVEPRARLAEQNTRRGVVRDDPPRALHDEDPVGVSVEHLPRQTGPFSGRRCAMNRCVVGDRR